MTAWKKHFNLWSVLLMVGIICLGLFSLNCYIVQNEKNNEIKKMEEQLQAACDEGHRMAIEIERRSDHFTVEAYATRELGMCKLENYQIQYLQQDVFGNAELLHREEEDGFFTRVTKAFSVITDFFE